MCEIMEKFGEKREAKGKVEGRLNTLIELVQDGVLDVQNAAQRADMTPEAFQKLVVPGA